MEGNILVFSLFIKHLFWSVYSIGLNFFNRLAVPYRGSSTYCGEEELHSHSQRNSQCLVFPPSTAVILEKKIWLPEQFGLAWRWMRPIIKLISRRIRANWFTFWVRESWIQLHSVVNYTQVSLELMFEEAWKIRSPKAIYFYFIITH